jgi:hypothetical protein
VSIEETAPQIAAEDVEEEQVVEEEEKAAEVEPPEPVAICGRCGADIDEVDLTVGAAGEVYDALLCRDCYPEVARMAQRAAGHTGEALSETEPEAEASTTLEEILAELRILTRDRKFSDGDSLNVARIMAIVAQVLALSMAILGPVIRSDVAGEGAFWLLAGIFMQLVALTMFVLARKQ